MSPLLTEGLTLSPATTGTTGERIVPSDSPLTRLNYFDGKFLRADDLQREQLYLRRLVQLGNQGLGTGVVYGMTLSLNGRGQLALGAGLAVDAAGRPLLLPSSATVDVATLLDAASRISATSSPKKLTAGAAFGGCVESAEEGGATTALGSSLYVVCVSHAESLCGTEDVYGRLCEEACVTATDRPYVVEGIVVRALPLTLRTPTATSKAVALNAAHLRSLVASAYFADERLPVGSLISAAGLRSGVWCAGAEAAGGNCVPLGILARRGATTAFVDAWTARRERIEAPARRYWAWRMAMRPWDVFLAHVLQFQCQLHDLLGVTPDGGSEDPCAGSGRVLSEASRYLRGIDESYTRQVETLAAAEANRANAFTLDGGLAELTRLRAKIDGAIRAINTGSRDRVLIDGGIVELPSAGYLPVALGTTTVNEQVRRLVGPGVDLRFCVVRPDFVPHALEEAQHMDRISLLAGLDDPAARPEVDVLVPNGRVETSGTPSRGGWDTELRTASNVDLATVLAAGAADTTTSTTTTTSTRAAATTSGGIALHGAGRSERLPSGGGAFHFAGAQEVEDDAQVVAVLAGAHAFATDETKRAAMVDSAATAANTANTANTVNTANTANTANAATTTTRVADDAALRTFTPNVRVSEALVSRLAKDTATVKTARANATINAAATAPAAPDAPRTTSTSTAAAPIRVAREGADAATADTTAGVTREAAEDVTSTAAGWVTVRAEQDLFALGTGGSSPVSLEVMLELRGRTRALFRVRMSGTFAVTRPAVQSANGLAMSGHVSGTYALQVALADSAKPETGGALDVDVILVRGADANGRTTVQVRLASTKRPQIVWEAEATYEDDPAAFRVVLGVGVSRGSTSTNTLSTSAAATTTTKLTLAALAARTSDDALTAGSALRMLSTSALALLGDALADAGLPGATFVDSATRTLFPPVSAVSDLTVRPTLDWVLFHRRRTKQCGAESRREAAAPARTYQVYHRLAKTAREAAAIDRALRTDTNVDKIGFDRVDVVAFAGGLAVLDTPVETLLADWRRANPANSLIYGAIATSAQDDDALVTQRLTRVVSALAPVSPVDADQTELTTLPNVPASLAVPGTDGIVFLVTMPRATEEPEEPAPAVSRVRVAVLAQSGREAAGGFARVPLRADVLTFDGETLRRDSASAVLFEQLQTLVVPAAARQVVSAQLATPEAPNAADEAHLKALIEALRTTSPAVLDPAALVSTPAVAQITTADQKEMLEENDVTVDAVLGLVLRNVQLG